MCSSIKAIITVKIWDRKARGIDREQLGLPRGPNDRLQRAMGYRGKSFGFTSICTTCSVSCQNSPATHDAQTPSRHYALFFSPRRGRREGAGPMP